MGMPNTGSDVARATHHIPMPRMTNTYLAERDGHARGQQLSRSSAGSIVNFGGGQVDITTGKFRLFRPEAF